jgi:hypothetical protein
MSKNAAVRKTTTAHAPPLTDRAAHFRRYADEIRELLIDMAEQNELRRAKLQNLARQYARLALRAEPGGLRR